MTLGGAKRLFGRADERKVRWLLVLFFLALAVPAAVLIAQAYGRLKWESFRQNQLLAADLVGRIDADLRAAIGAEDARSFGDYAFLVVEGDAAANFVQRSPLAAFPVASALPGVLGYFQVDAAGRLTTPLLPDAGVDPARYGIAPDEERARRALADSLRAVLTRNRLAHAARDEQAAARGGQSATRGDAVATTGSLAAGAQGVARDAESKDAAAAANAPAMAERRAPAQFAQSVQAEADQANFDKLLHDPGATAERATAPPRAANLQTAVRPVARDVQLPVEAQRKVNKAEAAAPAAPAPSLRPSASDERQKRTEQSLVAEQAAAGAAAEHGERGRQAPRAAATEVRVRTFEGDVDPFEIAMLGTGELVMFRNVWRDGQRYVQGALVDRDRFLAQTITAPFRASSLAAIGALTVEYRGAAIGAASAAPAGYASASVERLATPDGLVGTPLYRARLSPPFGDLELAFAAARLPAAPGAVLLAWISVVLTALLSGGFYAMYRFAVGQIRLARQQQDFVSAVSHELKTPLTSIRMYGEMLKAGWADDAKKQVYYDYIHSESERLSRLIENVLQLARLTRRTHRLDLKRTSVPELLDLVRSKIATQVERSGFALEVRDTAPPGAAVLVDADCFTQIVINLVDNALKFAVNATPKTLEIAARGESGGRVLFTVRDYGPGIPKAQMKKIFELFYRPENELTRETAGTGIGLALVRQLATAMTGQVDVRNCEPGAEFRVSFPAAG